MITHAVVAPCVETLVAQTSMSAQRIKQMVASLAPLGGATTRLTCSWGIKTKALLEAPTEHWIEQGGRPSAGQSVQPVSLSMVCLRPGRVVSWQVAKPSMAERL